MVLDDYSKYKFLGKINEPRELKNLELKDLKVICEEARDRIIEVVSENGGHLSSNLGVVELTVALHYVFNTPRDKIVWDVGHQTYTHKLLTGRAKEFNTLRQGGGLSGFPKRVESEYDVFDVGHSSTSISAAVGFCEARDLMGEDHKVLAVIGDGSMTAGVAFEGLNQAGHLHRDLIVVLNDNEMSISKNIGAISKYLNNIITGSIYTSMKEKVYNFAKSFYDVGEQAISFSRKVEEGIKSLIVPGVLFEELGMEYVGPVEGHDLRTLIDTFRRIKNWRFPVLVHVVTKKGKGFVPAELRPESFHSAPKYDIQTGEPKSPSACTYTSVFGSAMVKLAEQDERIIAITAAMPQGTGLDIFEEKFPKRFYDVGIAEQHSLIFAGALGLSGFKPVTAIYSTFIQRAYDQIFHDICLQNADVVLALDRAGIV
ncbi:MAG: 1-deoxy-D-xylulose-5-phosphate synthase, partial [Candidatus Coatesbacteria bacterium]|nr:1-deoxy-D-xylulose-5-phosphate synthase [Candidatus Coatesbacteria bacterium]